MKHYHQKSYGNYNHNPYQAAAYGPRRVGHFRGPLRDARAGDLNRNHSPDRRPPTNHSRNSSSNGQWLPAKRKSSSNVYREDECCGYYGPSEAERKRRSAATAAAAKVAEMDTIVGQVHKGVEKRIAKLHKQIGALKDEERRAQPGQGSDTDSCGGDSDNESPMNDPDYFDSRAVDRVRVKIKVLGGVSKKGLKECLEKAEMHWEEKKDGNKCIIDCVQVSSDIDLFHLDLLFLSIVAQYFLSLSQKDVPEMAKCAECGENDGIKRNGMIRHLAGRPNCPYHEVVFKYFTTGLR
jgi:hypothetical protein